MSGLTTALSIAFARPRAYALAGVSGAAMLLLVAWGGGFLSLDNGAWSFVATPREVGTIVALSALFGLLVPLEVTAVAKARGAAAVAGGAAGAVVGLLGVSCCAPLLIPALLSFVGFSGTALLSINAVVYSLSVPLTLASLALMLLSIALVSRTIAAACRLPSGTAHAAPHAPASEPRDEIVAER